MKKLILWMVVGLFADVLFAGEVEPYSEMTQTSLIVFQEDVAVIKQRILESLSQLKSVELDSKTGSPLFEVRKLDRQIPTARKLVMAEAKVDDEILITVWWTPPNPPPQKVSDGGANIRPVRSTIDIDFISLKDSRQATAVKLRRCWTYNALAHIPYTSIPFGRLEDTRFGSYVSDREWLRNLAPEKIRGSFPNQQVDNSDVIAALKALTESQKK